MMIIDCQRAWMCRMIRVAKRQDCRVGDTYTLLLIARRWDMQAKLRRDNPMDSNNTTELSACIVGSVTFRDVAMIAIEELLTQDIAITI